MEGTELAEEKGMERSVLCKVENVVMKRSGSVSKAKDEASSRSWIQMVAEAKMLDAVRAMKQMEELTSAEPEAEVVEGSSLAEKVSSSSSLLLGEFFHGERVPSEKMAYKQQQQQQQDGCSSWVVEMEKILKDTDRRVEKARWAKPCIYRVAQKYLCQHAYINGLVTDFLCAKLPGVIIEEKLGLHPLQMFHRSFCGLSKTVSSQELEQCEYTRIPSAVELREAGVHFKRSDTQSAEDIDFENGVLSMPRMNIEDGSEIEFFNLMAFERLHGNAGSAATAYMIFMDNIIDSERDVAFLRSRGILSNLLSRDKEAADLFNTLGKGATMDTSSKLYLVRWMVAKHCTRPWPKLQASFKHTYYLRNPWVFISAVAGTTLLALTILQTVYTVLSFYTKS